MAFIVDASVTMTWMFDDEATATTGALWLRANGEGLLVPSVWPLEVANAVVAGERRRRVTPAMSDEFLFLLDRLIVTVDQPEPIGAWTRTLQLARATGLSVYDASYLELALRSGREFATLDVRLAAAAASHGVKLVAT